ncbi:hypothetical protein KFK09_005183 [Dendrobium nobile]|uniref:Uncharacterized protein n=1 Tax=Dendrobium nobile TaxID=94219 RepID=A0A8T3BYG5_DENNO|nr:hypothetical protein KFK09_005183 [Dendrobium nobile]
MLSNHENNSASCNDTSKTKTCMLNILSKGKSACLHGPFNLPFKSSKPNLPIDNLSSPAKPPQAKLNST